MSRARDVADVQDNLGGAVPPFVAGKNFLVNGGMDFWQRGTSTSGSSYGADRWYCIPAAGTGTFAQSNATPVVSGSQYFMRFTASANGTAPYLEQPIEQAQVIPLRGQAMILSGYIRGSFTGNVAFNVLYSNSTDARASVSTSVTTSYSTTAITSSWVRFTATFTVPTDAVGLKIQVGASGIPVNNTQTMDWSNFQLEQGSLATPFARAGGTIQGELAACQRYYYKRGGGPLDGAYTPLANGSASLPTQGEFYFQFPVIMRVSPTSVDYSTLAVWDGITLTAINAAPTIPAGGTGVNGVRVYGPVASGLTQYRPYILLTNNSTSGYMAFSAEL
jgi:hypothetical protein